MPRPKKKGQSKPRANPKPAVRGWEETQLWGLLPGSSELEVHLRPLLDKVQNVLVSGDTSPKDFTLHDAGHAFRVAELMAVIIPEETLKQLSQYELAFLLLSAYLHDIGMVPEQSKEKAVYGFLATEAADSLNDAEKDQLQKWLDDEPSGSAVPIFEEPVTPEQVSRVEMLTAYYIRERHNDWSAEWIQKEADEGPLGTYVGWRDDLIALCKSHHEGYNRLTNGCFDARPVGSPGEVVNLRYLAAVLRVADILEFDPERTPDVVFRHRDINENSAIYWAKDHQISPQITSDSIVISARPNNARLHRAIDDMIRAIDAELNLCVRLKDEEYLERGLTPNRQYEWNLPITAKRDVKPAEGPDGPRYEYIDGAFRPNTEKLLELLSGNALYGNQPFIAVRELLQNAFDAVKEQIASKRLRMEKPADPRWEEQLGEEHCVSLKLESRGHGSEKRWWLVCVDDGVGMNRDIIQSHVLVSGSARRHEVLDLERKCKAAGFRLGRTGQFGIGILAYFLLADRVEIRTRRSSAHDDADNVGWSFETEGVGSFGELRRSDFSGPGSEIALRLKPGAIGGDPERFYIQLNEYLGRTLVRIPCRFRLSSSVKDLNSDNRGPGWFRTTDEWTRILVEQIRFPERRHELPEELVPSRQRQKRMTQQEHVNQAREEALKCLRWFPEDAGELPDGLGKYRILVPYFQLAGGPCAGFMRIRKRRQRVELDLLTDCYLFLPEPKGRQSWRGINLQELRDHRGLEDAGGVCVEMDFDSPKAGILKADRLDFTTAAPAERTTRWVRDRCKELRTARFGSQKSDHDAVNATCCNQLTADSNPRWALGIADGKRNSAIYGEIGFPATCGSGVGRSSRAKSFRWRKKRLTIVPCFNDPAGSKYLGARGVDPTFDTPNVLAVHRGHSLRLCPVWSRTPDKGESRLDVDWALEFPPTWPHLACVLNDYTPVLWNRDHVLARCQEASVIEWLSRVQEEKRADIREGSFRAELLQSPARGAAWFRWLIRGRRWDLWLGITENLQVFSRELWDTVFRCGATKERPVIRSLSVFDDIYPPREILDVSLKGVSSHPIGGQFTSELPDPGPEWTITVEKSREELRSERERRQLDRKIAAFEKTGTSRKKRIKSARSGVQERNAKSKRKRKASGPASTTQRTPAGRSRKQGKKTKPSTRTTRKT